VARQVGWGSAQQQSKFLQRPRDKAGISEVAASKGHINAFVDQINRAIGEIDIQLNLRMTRKKIRQQGHQKVVGHDGGTHTQPPAGGLLRKGQHGLRIIQVIQDASTALVKQLTFGCELKASGTSLKESHPHLLLQPGYTLANGRCGNRQCPSCRNETAKLRRLDKCKHSAEFVHPHLHPVDYRRFDPFIPL
jgi:hypothetical protein